MCVSVCPGEIVVDVKFGRVGPSFASYWMSELDEVSVSSSSEADSTSLIIEELQIKTTVRYHLTPARKVIIKKSTNNK